jgi:hypothetical protein
MKKNWGIKAVIIMAAVFTVLSIVKVDAKAATSYSYVYLDPNKVVKSGNYYFKYNFDTNKTGISTKKDGKYTDTPLTTYFYSNGKQCYYMKNENVLCKYVFSSHKSTKIKTFKADSNGYYIIGASYGNFLFMNDEKYEGTPSSYAYNLKTGKLKKISSDSAITDAYGGYVVTHGGTVTDLANEVILYKLKSDGSLKKVKVLGKYVRYETFAGGKLFYSSYKEDGSSFDSTEVSLYSAKKDGSSTKKLATFKSSDGLDVVVFNITSKKCYVNMDSTTYIYTYSTKKLTKYQ